MKYSYGEMIHRYLDGLLSEEHERQLFDELAHNPELRHTLRVEFELQKAATQDSTSLLPPESIRTGVFSALDIPTSLEVAEIAASTSPQLLTFSSIALVSMLFGGMMVWLGMQGQEGFTTQFRSRENISSHSYSSTSYEATRAATSVPATSVTANAQNVQLPIHHSRSSNQTTGDNSLPVANVSTFNLSSSDILQPLFAPTSVKILNQRTHTPFAMNTLSLPQFLEIPEDIPISVSMRGMQSLQGAEGVALTALYALDDEQALGVELSTARLTRYEQRRTSGITKQVAITDESTIVGSVYRISLPSMSIGEFSPYVQSFAGATTKGLPVGRATVGLQWTPDRRVTLSGGIDGMIYGYQTNGQWKAGVMATMVYGVSVVL